MTVPSAGDRVESMLAARDVEIVTNRWDDLDAELHAPHGHGVRRGLHLATGVRAPPTPAKPAQTPQEEEGRASFMLRGPAVDNDRNPLWGGAAFGFRWVGMRPSTRRSWRSQ